MVHPLGTTQGDVRLLAGGHPEGLEDEARATNILLLLAPISVLLGLAAVAAFVWALRSGQYDDIRGSAERIVLDHAEPIPADPTPENRRPKV